MPMNKKNKLQLTDQLIVEALKGSAIELLWTEHQKAGPEWVLRVFVDHENGVTFETCSEASRRILDALELEDPLGGDYKLEVSSAGVDRPLRNAADFKRFCGERIYVKLHKAQDGLKVFTGTLLACDGENIEIENEADQKAYNLSLTDMAKATLKPILNFN